MGIGYNFEELYFPNIVNRKIILPNLVVGDFCRSQCSIFLGESEKLNHIGSNLLDLGGRYVLSEVCNIKLLYSAIVSII